MEKKQIFPIFYDPQKKRWSRIKNFFWGAISLLFLLVVAFIVSIYLTPALNHLPLRPVHHLSAIKYPKLEEKVSKYRPEYKLRNWEKLVKATSSFASLPIKNISKPLTIGFLVNYDDASFTSLSKHLDAIDVVIGEFLHLQSPRMNIIEDDAKKQNQVKNYITLHKPQTKIIPLINNIQNGQWQPELITSLLQSSANQQKVIQALLAYVKQQDFSGINIDFEEIPPKNRDKLTQFIRLLTTTFHASNLSVSMAVIADDPVYDLKALSKTLDYIIVMAYDEHWAEGTPGPIASLDWFANSIHTVLADIPPEKLVIGLGNYGYDWKNKHKVAEEKSFQDVMTTINLASGKVTFDPTAMNPTFNYLENNTIAHSVWFLDSASVFNQLAITQHLHPLGYSVWRLGSEDPAIWKLLGHTVGRQDIKNLEKIASGYSVNYQGKGEVLRVITQPHDGYRKITYHPKSHLITNVDYKILPETYVLNRYGATNAKKLALTFDDGPDPVYTPKILDILKETNTHATFFVIGANALFNSKLLKREYREGHDIGNHTFTHPNITEISPQQLKMQVIFTQRLLESSIGRGSHLFRPPYAEDTDPDTPDEVQSIDSLSQSGYLIVGMNIDPNDWLQPGTDHIIKSILDGVDQHLGNIILLHDSGGNRDQTVAALPTIISELKSRGYQLVTVSELLNIPQNEIMPLVAKKNLWEIVVDKTSFLIMLYGFNFIKLLFFLGIIFGITRIVLLCILAIYQKTTKNKISYPPTINNSVAIIVPAYNEEKVICRTIDRLLEIDHPDSFEIIVVDDGSKDNTLSLLNAHYANHPSVKIISQLNSGKPTALNNAINHTNAEIIVTLDADTLFSNITIMELVSKFANPVIGAVAGNIKVGNKINLLTKMQAIEYITSQNLERRAFRVLDSITVVPGAVSAWRRDIVVSVGGFSQDTLAEDADLTFKVRKLGYEIEFAEKAIAFTEAPDTIKTFLQQRYRWMFGTFQVAWKNLNVLFRPRYGYLGFIALPSILINQIILPLIAPLMDLLLILTLISSLINRIYHPLGYRPEALILVLTYYLLFTVVDFLTGWISFMLERSENKKLLFLLIPQRFFYRQLIYYVAIKTLFVSLRGQIVGWNKVIRKATVSQEQS